MKTNKFIALTLAALAMPSIAAAQPPNGLYNAVVNVTILAALAVFVFVIASLTTHISTIARIMIRKAEKNKKTLSLIALVGLSVQASATESGIERPMRFMFESVPADSTSKYILIAVFAVLLLMVLLLSRSMFAMLGVLYGIDQKKEVAVEPALTKESAWDRRLTKWNSAVPIEKEVDVMLDHDYDGIKELDNSLPPWWKYSFYLTIVFSFVYVVYYHMGGNGPSQHEEYAMEMRAAERKKAIAAVTNRNGIDEANLTLLIESAALEHGKSLYAQNCATCHGTKGEGLAGPNLTDPYWLHGGDLRSIYAVIKNGVISKGMVKWEGILKPTEIHQVASFVYKMRETPLPGREPQGDEVKDDLQATTGGVASRDIQTRY